MRFTIDSATGVNLIRAYADGEFQINEDRIRGSCVIAADARFLIPHVKSIADLDAALSEKVLALGPELLVLGTGAEQQFPTAAWLATFLERMIGVEVMTTAAACRTYTVLISERRRAVAILIA